MTPTRIVHFVQGKGLTVNMQDWIGSPIVPLSNVGFPKAMRSFIEENLSDVLSNQLVVSIIAVKITKEVIILIKFCSDLHIPIIWNGPIRQFSDAEQDWIEKIDPTSKLFENDPKEPLFPVNMITADLVENEIIIDNLNGQDGWGVVSSQTFFKNWPLFSRVFVPRQNYLLIKSPGFSSSISNFDTIGAAILSYIRLINLVSIDTIQELLDFIPILESCDQSKKDTILFGIARNEEEFNNLLSLHGVTKYSIVPLLGIDAKRYHVVLEGIEGGSHYLSDTSLYSRCSCRRVYCPASLVVNWQNSRQTEEWGLLTFLLRQGFIRYTERFPNPRNLLETVFFDETNLLRIELTTKGREFLKFGVSFSIYVTTDHLLRNHLVADEPIELIDTLQTIYKINPLTLTNVDTNEPSLVKMIHFLSFVHGYARIHDYAQTQT